MHWDRLHQHHRRRMGTPEDVDSGEAWDSGGTGAGVHSGIRVATRYNAQIVIKRFFVKYTRESRPNAQLVISF